MFDLSAEGNELAIILLRNLVTQTEDEYERAFLSERQFNQVTATNENLQDYVLNWIRGESIQPIKYWDVRQVTDMHEIFVLIERVNSDRNILDLTYWDVSNVTNMDDAFSEGYRDDSARLTFTGINNWNTCKVIYMKSTFANSRFNCDISNWNVSNVEDMTYMFQGATSFNQDIGEWDTSSVESMNGMFNMATSFNQNIGGWHTSSLEFMTNMLQGATSFNYPLNEWDVSRIEDMSNMFSEATSFNQPLTDWDVSNVKNMSYMFQGATSFNQPLNEWDVSNVENMSYMFQGATSFNQSLNEWDVISVENMDYMFQEATSFSQVLTWDITNLISRENMFEGSAGNIFVEDEFDFNFEETDDIDEREIHNEVCNDLITTEQPNIQEYLTESNTFLLISKDSGGFFYMICYDKEYITQIIGSKANWYYECKGYILEDGHKRLRTTGNEFNSLIKIPMHTDGMMAYIPLIQLETLLISDHRIYYLYSDKIVTHSTTWINSKFGDDPEMRTWVTCNSESQILVYKLKICTNPEMCLKSLGQQPFGTPDPLF